GRSALRRFRAPEHLLRSAFRRRRPICSISGGTIAAQSANNRRVAHRIASRRPVMHDLDRALQEFESADTELQSESYEFEEETDAESDYEGESDGETNGNGETDGSYETEYELSQESGRQGDYEAVFDELEEMEQAAALLEVQDEGELEQFLGGLIGKVAKKLGAFVPADLRKALGDTLRKVARSALPKAGAILGNLVAPGVGGVIGNQVAAGASKMFGLELEGLSYEDQEFEVARRVVGLSAEATKAMSQ